MSAKVSVRASGPVRKAPNNKAAAKPPEMKYTLLVTKLDEARTTIKHDNIIGQDPNFYSSRWVVFNKVGGGVVTYRLDALESWELTPEVEFNHTIPEVEHVGVE